MPAIRLIGEHHTSDRDGTVLTIADEAVARVNPNTVTLEHARNLVAWGRQNGSTSRRATDGPSLGRSDHTMICTAAQLSIIGFVEASGL